MEESDREDRKKGRGTSGRGETKTQKLYKLNTKFLQSIICK